jgi:A/G-specific adenine glycosylase
MFPWRSYRRRFRSLSEKLIAQWYLKARRPLPWRQSPGVYATVVSEIMAQQTRIATMLP